MKLTVLGVGGAGCRLAARLREAEPADRPFVVDIRAFDVDSGAFETLDLAAEESRRFHPDPLTDDGTGRGGGGDAGAATDSGESRAVSTESAAERPAPDESKPVDDGANGVDRMRTAAEENALELRRVASDAVRAETDGVLLVAGLGGATGAGATPALADALGEFHDLPTYALSVLPAESEGDAAAENAAVGLRALEATVDGQLLFDNGVVGDVTERPTDEAAAAEAYAETNGRIAEQVATLFSAGEAGAERSVGERVLDASELVATLGEGGYAMLGYRRERVRESPGLLDRLLSREQPVDSVERYSTIETAVRRALLRHRSFDADLPAAERALLVAVGPPEWLDRDALADGRRLLTQETGSATVRGADTPVPDGTDLRILVVCAGSARPARVAALLD